MNRRGFGGRKRRRDEDDGGNPDGAESSKTMVPRAASANFFRMARQNYDKY